MTPHLGFVSQPVYHKLTQGSLSAVEAFLQGEPLINLVQ
jgi:phosphoglycerate dehydrogenase-like enzyme